MINMHSLHTDDDYIVALNSFLSRPNTPDCDHSASEGWNVFRTVHLKISKNRCPICECLMDGSVTRHSKHGITAMLPTMDHYRPIDGTMYPKLKCDDKNYLIMCKDCNNFYKGNNFPLHSSTPSRETTATCTLSIINEKPLIVNPIYDDVLELFELVFKQTSSGRKVLELTPKHTQSSNDYLYEKAKETIRLFGLGNCTINVSLNLNVQHCRIDILSDHFNKFYEFLDALKANNKIEAAKVLKKNNLKDYGFYAFILKKQYKNLIP